MVFIHTAVAAEICSANLTAGVMNTVGPVHVCAAVVVCVHELMCES